LIKANKIITKGGGGSIYSDAMSMRSKMSKFSRRTHSLADKKDQEHLEKINEQEEIQQEQKEEEFQKCHICENELTIEESVFNSQIVDYKQSKDSTSQQPLGSADKLDKISEFGHDVLKAGIDFDKNNLLCAKCMFDLFVTKGIVPQTKQSYEAIRKRASSETRSDAGLRNGDTDDKIQKEIIKAKHLGNNISGVQPKSSLIAAAESTFNGYSFKPSMSHKQNHLASNFSELTGSTSFIDQSQFNNTRALMEFPKLLSKGKINTQDLYAQLSNLRPGIPSSTTKEEHGWTPFQNMQVDRHHHRKKNDISEYSDALFSHAPS